MLGLILGQFSLVRDSSVLGLDFGEFGATEGAPEATKRASYATEWTPELPVVP